MVVYADQPDQLYQHLAAMERAAEASGFRRGRDCGRGPGQGRGRAGGAAGAGGIGDGGGDSGPQLQFHNLVNNADVVPRLLGTSLDPLHSALESYLPLMRVRPLPNCTTVN
jgi:hypothetical protein